MTELWTSAEAASFLGVASADVAGRVLRRAGYTPVARQSGRSGQNLWSSDDVRTYASNRRPGTRTDLKEKAMSTTTEYGSWYNFERSNSTVEDTVAVFLGEFEDDYDLDGLVDAYRSAINDALPEGVSLNGDQFHGPYPMGHDVHDQIDEAIESVDLGALAAEYEKS